MKDQMYSPVKYWMKNPFNKKHTLLEWKRKYEKIFLIEQKFILTEQ